MKTTFRTTSTSLTAVLLIYAFAPTCVQAQTTPGQIPQPSTYEGSKELQRRQQEQQQQQQRQQQQPPQQYPSIESSGSGVPVESRSAWQKRPLLAPERNPLLGRWNPQGVAPAAQNSAAAGEIGKTFGADLGNLAMGMVGGMLQSACDEIFGGGIIEFRPGTMVAIGRDGKERVLNRVEYRGGGARIAVLPQEQAPIGVWVFDFNGANRITATDLRCVMARAGTAAAAGPAQPGAAEARAQPPAASATGRPAQAAAPQATSTTASTFPLRNNVVYVCGAERVVVAHCRSDSKRGNPVTRDSGEDYCSVIYPDRPKRNDITVETSELRASVVSNLQSCKVE